MELVPSSHKRRQLRGESCCDLKDNSDFSSETLLSHPTYTKAGRWFRVIMSLTLTGLAMYVALSLGFILSVDYIIEAYVYQWRVDLRSLEVSPDPASFVNSTDNTPTCLTFGSNDYVNISFVVSITNNPSWLEVDVESVDLIEPDVTPALFRVSTPPLKGENTVLARLIMRSDFMRRQQYTRLWNMKSVRCIPANLTLLTRFTIFGYQSSTLFDVVASSACVAANRELTFAETHPNSALPPAVVGKINGVYSFRESNTAALLYDCYC
ncbi:hypothetical protein FOL47_001754 [Perkinsus chesapeaki]|uniref:Uncharacterized protein n=1 Tax=Perkinsus chesapeaki TaxID=330153 RepID=A0A7J6MHN7_PERCH|nr:hypothetical protein FOL47_001754 [Perkinsus chesapeaki]